jgi:hypothetical protein
MQGGRRAARDAVVIIAITFLLAEIAARLLTGPAGNGVLTILHQPLLPFRPDADVVKAWVAKTKDASYLVGDEALGWVVKKGGKGEGYEANAQGVRTADPTRVFDPTPPAGKIRIVAVGDSFTHGDDVKNDETWEVALEKLRADLEVLNLGVPAFGTDQALLRWRREVDNFSPQISILGIWPENICRNLNIARYYLNPASGFMTKPRFLVENGALKLINSPVVGPEDLPKVLSEPESASILKDDYWYDPRETTRKAYQHVRVLQALGSIVDLMRRKSMRDRLYSGEDPAGDAITVRIAEAFAAEAKAKNTLPLVLLIPMRDHLEGKKLYVAENSLPLVRDLRKAGLDVLDMGPPIAKASEVHGMSALYLPSGHLTPLGNRVLAEQIEKALRRYLDRFKEK